MYITRHKIFNSCNYLLHCPVRTDGKAVASRVLPAYDHLLFLTNPNQWSQTWRLKWDEELNTCGSLWKDEASVMGLMEEESSFFPTHKAAVSLPTFPLAQPNQLGPSSSPPSVLISDKSTGANSRWRRSINLSAWQQHPIAHWDAPPFWAGSSRLSVTGSERTWQDEPDSHRTRR